MREESRTRIILDAAREQLALRYDIETIDVNALALPPVTPGFLKDRTGGRVPEEIVVIARKLASEQTCKRLLAAESAEEIINIFSE